MKLSIVIPVYNEEKAVGTVIEDCRTAAKEIIGQTTIKEVEIIVVNDGSNDNTANILKEFKEITILDFKDNRGYGAALKSGFGVSGGDFIGFLDGDGTCNPLYFIELFKAMLETDSDICIGSRIHAQSKMPRIRRLGNFIFASMINFLGHAKVTDSTSGMRLMRRGVLEKIYPLPDGLHFTPAMSCKAIMDRKLKIVEVPVAYEARRGKSKLGIVKDGVRFIKTITDIALTYNPLRFFGTISLIFIALALVYTIGLILKYFKTYIFHDTMIYRVISIVVFSVISLNFLMIGAIAQDIISMLSHKRPCYRKKGFRLLLENMFSQRKLIVIGLFLILCGIFINYRTIYQYITTGIVKVHWLIVVTGAFFVLTGFQIVTLGVLKRIVAILTDEVLFIEERVKNAKNNQSH